jgi:hypothetical protein
MHTFHKEADSEPFERAMVHAHERQPIRTLLSGDGLADRLAHDPLG